MTKKILITAGPVYGKIDDNKIISNRVRGIWAAKLAHWLAKEHKFDVYLLVADIIENSRHIESYMPVPTSKTIAGPLLEAGSVKRIIHSGYHDYAAKCVEYASQVDAAVMAAAVLNYIPETTYEGKLPAKQERISLHFMLAPKVINEMKKVNPKMTLIGCKLLFSDDEETLVDAAYKVVLDAKCNMVIANDGKLGLKTKYLVHQDKTVIKLEDDFDSLYGNILAHIQDEHWSTNQRKENHTRCLKYSQQFEGVIERWQHKFVRRQDGKDLVFGSVAVRHVDPGFDNEDNYLISPREKEGDFDRWDGVVCDFDWDNKVINTWTNHLWDEEADDFRVNGKATLNAPLLARHLKTFPDATAVVHYHDPIGDDAPVPQAAKFRVDYAPPGTDRDNGRLIPAPWYYIEGHGWIVALDENFEPLKA